MGLFRIKSIRVQDVVLHNEYQVKENGNIAQKELHGVSRDAAPIALKARVKHQLHQ
jgi:hypothetical protein